MRPFHTNMAVGDEMITRSFAMSEFHRTVTEIANLLVQGKYVEAIKLYREASGVGLKEAKDACELIRSTPPVVRYDHAVLAARTPKYRVVVRDLDTMDYHDTYLTGDDSMTLGEALVQAREVQGNRPACDVYVVEVKARTVRTPRLVQE